MQTELWQAILAHRLIPEQTLTPSLIDQCPLDVGARRSVTDQAARLIGQVRTDQAPILDSFLQEYSLSEREGVALMCLAEALLRIPDASTRDRLIEDKLSFSQWQHHLGHSDNLWVNASTWGLALTGKVLALADGNSLQQSLKRLSDPLVRKGVISAIGFLGEQFVLGETLAKAQSRGARSGQANVRYSYDMLGEGARTEADAKRYLKAYEQAVAEVQVDASKPLIERSGISVKLSALYPRFEFSHREQALDIIAERVLPLARKAYERGLPLTIDAEESARQTMTLTLVARLLTHPDLKGWGGLGIAVQAYCKTALPVCDWLIELAKSRGERLCVRLVKGAYWDSEIKLAQERGLSDFPVLTRKCNSDLSYLVCAARLLQARPIIFPAFATHNAHTLTAVLQVAGNREGFELQRLYGMGGGVYRQARNLWPDLPPVRIYAPVGSHKELLAYLVRRLIENGANSSFVHQLADARITDHQLAADPIAKAAASQTYRPKNLAKPQAVFGTRPAAKGLDLDCPKVESQCLRALELQYQQAFEVVPLVDGLADIKALGLPSQPCVNPAHCGDTLGRVSQADQHCVDMAYAVAEKHWPSWRMRPVYERAQCLRRAAELLEGELLSWMSLIVREAGKTWSDALAEVREAIDFCRYYADQAENLMANAQALPSDGPGIAGEVNTSQWQGRGVFVCISPWNFPLAIFMGQVVAALVAGNCVLAKPAPQTPIIAHRAVLLLHRCGIPKAVLSFLPGDSGVGQALVAHQQCAGVAFTGSVATAQRINRTLAAKDGAIVPLIAETGGQNVLLADSSALPEQLTDDIIRSAFASTGQRCSALRVLYLQEEIYSPVMAMVRGAMDALTLGDPKNISTDIGPVIDQAARDRLQTYIEQQKESALGWYASASSMPDNGYYLKPHLFEINDIQQIPGEQFGPILHVIKFKANQIAEILNSVNATGFGLTFGIHTRIESRAENIAAEQMVGNVYVNRNMIGAVVGLQPFGGVGLSGTGFKAGGSHYLTRFAVEKTISINTVAVGGNTQLLNLWDD